eukprot:Opistho-2@31365
MILVQIFLYDKELPDMRFSLTPFKERRGSLHTSISHCTSSRWHSTRYGSGCTNATLFSPSTRLISSMMSSAGLAEVVCMLNVKRRDRGFVFSSERELLRVKRALSCDNSGTLTSPWNVCRRDRPRRSRSRVCTVVGPTISASPSSPPWSSSCRAADADAASRGPVDDGRDGVLFDSSEERAAVPLPLLPMLADGVGSAPAGSVPNELRFRSFGTSVRGGGAGATSLSSFSGGSLAPTVWRRRCTRRSLSDGGATGRSPPDAAAPAAPVLPATAGPCTGTCPCDVRRTGCCGWAAVIPERAEFGRLFEKLSLADAVMAGMALGGPDTSAMARRSATDLRPSRWYVAAAVSYDPSRSDRLISSRENPMRSMMRIRSSSSRLASGDTWGRRWFCASYPSFIHGSSMTCSSVARRAGVSCKNFLRSCSHSVDI